MIFVSRKSGVVELTENLKNSGVSCKYLLQLNHVVSPV